MVKMRINKNSVALFLAIWLTLSVVGTTIALHWDNSTTGAVRLVQDEYSLVSSR